MIASGGAPPSCGRPSPLPAWTWIETQRRRTALKLEAESGSTVRVAAAGAVLPRFVCGCPTSAVCVPSARRGSPQAPARHFLPAITPQEAKQPLMKSLHACEIVRAGGRLPCRQGNSLPSPGQAIRAPAVSCLRDTRRGEGWELNRRRSSLFELVGR